MKGREARKALGRRPDAGQRLDARRPAANGNDAFRLSKSGLRGGERVGKLIDRPAQRLVLRGERAREAAEVRDQLAQVLLAAGQAAQDLLESPEIMPEQVAFLGSAERLGDLRRNVRVGPVLLSCAEAVSAAIDLEAPRRTPGEASGG